ncbi:MATE family efflux transporter [Tissierella sp. MSJ-40]|uniref:Multidrug export protein MepA n=1 Tax=Tissierella simiarum TaxID=2841534 RepID=A0ABS6E591_9FIRM|nr:MATE family efflux transporter [Tissierella simiarum]MBU5438092.1 MATE family efflux transporter [Tissierella simiarum]
MKKFFNYVIPAIIGMLVTSFYVIVDGMFVGQGVGSNALAAINIAFPPTLIATALTLIISVGGSTLVSMSLGSGETEEAVNKFNQSFLLLIISAIVLFLVGTFLSKPLAYALGSPDSLIGDVHDYIRFYFLFSVPLVLSNGLNYFLRNDGAPKLAMYAMIAGALTNIFLDYVFIFIFQWGVAGAAIATGLGQLISAIIPIIYFLRGKGILRFKKCKISFKALKDITEIGFPSFLTQSAIAVVTMAFNMVILKEIGESGVAVYSIISYAITVLNMVLGGIAQGVQPLLSFYYGAKEEEKIKYYYLLSLKSGLISAVVNFGICFFFGKGIISLFTSDKELISITYNAFNLFNLGSFFAAINIINSSYLQSIKMSKASNLICLLRGFITIQVSLLILPKLLGDSGIWLSNFSGELLVFLIAKLFLMKDQSLSFREEAVL